MKIFLLIFFITFNFIFHCSGATLTRKSSQFISRASNSDEVEMITSVPIISQIPVLGPIIDGIVAVIPKPIPKKIEFDVPFPISLIG